MTIHPTFGGFVGLVIPPPVFLLYTTILDHRAAGETVFFNNRFDAPTSDDHAAKWAKFIGLHRINNLIDLDTNKPFTRQNMEDYTHSLAPEDIRGTPEENEWSDELMQSWPALIGSIPQAVIDAATATARTLATSGQRHRFQAPNENTS